jgi:hypothetical protein
LALIILCILYFANVFRNCEGKEDVEKRIKEKRKGREGKGKGKKGNGKGKREREQNSYKLHT